MGGTAAQRHLRIFWVVKSVVAVTIGGYELGEERGLRMASEDRTRRNGELVNATALARHLCFERAYLVKLIDTGVIERRDDGKFDLDENRRRYILHLREERKRSPRSAADTEFTSAKAELIRLRIQEKQRDLIPREEAASDMEELIGLLLTGLSSMPARCGGRDLAVRRSIDKAVYDLRVELAEACSKLANERDEPSLEQQPGAHPA
jgi:hypothetical protein